MTIAVLAEKPSVARDLARVLGASRRGEGFLHGNGYVVSWVIGHLVALAEPHQIDPAWKRWQTDQLPMLPRSWPLVELPRTRDQLEVVRRILRSPKVERVVCATDAGREGELIFRLTYEHTGSTKPVDRLWISSLTPDAIRAGLSALTDGSRYDGLANAARGRAQADWLVGMNLSRAYTLAHRAEHPGREVLSVGRVQTPTLAMVVARELEIRAFVPEPYREVIVTFAPPDADTPTYRGAWFRGARPEASARRLAADSDEPASIAKRAQTGSARIASVDRTTKRRPPPLLYDLTELQRHANRLLGFTAKRTLTAAQKLYEQHKLLSYPRTDSRHLTADVAATLPEVVAAIRAPYEQWLAGGTGTRALGRRYVDDGKVSDHHAIIPTPVSAQGLRLGTDERRIYDLVCRRLLAAWHDDHRWSVITAITEICSAGETAGGTTVLDRYHSRGRAVEQEGWKVLDPPRRKAPKDDEEPLPADLAPGLERRVDDVEIADKQTRPPRPHTEATLLTAMERAGADLDDEELSAVMKESGLGTPATRAEIIETLLRRAYIERDGKSLRATDNGIQLIERVDPVVKTPALTGQWEARLRRIERGEDSLAAFMHGIEELVRSVVAAALNSPAGERKRRHGPPGGDEVPDPPEWLAPPDSDDVPDPPEPSALPAELWAPARIDSDDEPAGQSPPMPRVALDVPLAADAPLEQLLRRRFGHDAFRPHQEPVCRAVLAGHDVLLVMPTGAGKSLCYQLPGLARGGTTVVVSPLIALMEDQVAKLQEIGTAAERIHSGRPRAAAHEVERAYLDGRLDFLFIAPERLSVPGFPEMLARRPPVLVAIDEAHCISHWGHDFRPDYRMLGERLPLLRPAPVIAMTATATPLVQRDITDQLSLQGPSRFIHGFRRTNIAVEAAKTPPSARAEAVERVLGDSSRRPAIVYAPTRKETESLAASLAARFPAAAYHAGMTSGRRDRVQSDFLAGRLDVIVATIAFGMGVDKPDVRTVIHTGLPGTLEGYYQEIGRAGRDGKPSRAILLYSWADRHTHDFFYKRDYPEPEVLARLFEHLGPQPLPAEALRAATGIEPDVVEQALEKLWIHGGAIVRPDGSARRGPDAWRRPYLAQREHKRAQLDEMMRFAEARECRMVHLVTHFGDQEDSGEPCGQCDVCDPVACDVRRFREPTAKERAVLWQVLEALRERDEQTTGQLFRQLGETAETDRHGFERLIGGLVRSGLVQLREDSFVKDGKTIHFQRALLTADGARGGPDALAGLQLTVEAVAAKRRRRPPAARPPVTAAPRPRSPGAASDNELVERLTAWRLGVARRRGIPAFRILTNRTLSALVAARPRNEVELLEVSGIGPTTVRKHGARLLELLAGPSRSARE